MSAVTPPISLRLPGDLLEALDRTAAATRRSRSFLMQEALTRYLDDLAREKMEAAGPGRLADLLTLAGAGRRGPRPRGAEEVNSHIRWLRDNG